jgi:hypothetical protein
VLQDLYPPAVKVHILGNCGLNIVLAMIGISNINRASYREGVQSRTDTYIKSELERYIGINIGRHCLLLLFIALLHMGLV